MLTAYRRHRDDCKHRSRRYKGCSCPIWAQGKLHGVPLRRALDLTSWEAAAKKIRDLEINGDVEILTVNDAGDRFLADIEAQKLSAAMVGKYTRVVAELKRELGELPVRSVTPNDVRRIRESWKLASSTTQKRLEMVRRFFTFCLDSDWISKNPAKKVKSPVVHFEPTLSYTDEEMEKILWAAENIRIAHPKMPENAPRKLLALILLMRYSGLRISDSVLYRKRLLKDGNLFLRQTKTKQPVWVPLPEVALDALDDADEGEEYPFYNQIGKVKSCITEWQQRLKLVFVMAGVPDGHAHRLRDTFAVDLLVKGVALDVVSVLLGHASIRTTEKHYAPWVKARQVALTEAVKLTWAA